MNDWLPLASAYEEIDTIKRREPYRSWRCSSWGQETGARLVAAGIDTYMHAGNGGGKSNIGARLDFAFCAGEDSIPARDGSPILLPVLKPPVHWGLGVQSYKLGGAASIQALKDVIGKWPHEMGATIPGTACPSVVRIQHRNARSKEDWSTLYVFPYDGPRPEGPRLNGWHCDEPPPPMFLDAFRTRTKRGEKLYGYITMTPLEKRHWETILKQYPPDGQEFRKWAEGQIVGGRARVQWSTEDNELYSPRQIEELRQRAQGVWFEARWHGKHLNISGQCPWLSLLNANGEPVLLEAMKRCVPPKVERLVIQREDPEDFTRLETVAELHVFEEPIPGEPYYMPGDPARGFTDGRHDPDCFHVRNRRTKALAARLVGNIGAWGLGQAMAKVGRRYNNALANVLLTGGYGLQTMTSLRQAGYGSFAHARNEKRVGSIKQQLGTSETHEIRGEMIAAVERELREGTFDCPSAAVVQCLLDCRVDDNGRVEAGAGSHDEDLICWGDGSVYLSQYRAERREPPKPSEQKPKILTFAEIMAAQGGTPKKKSANARRGMPTFNGP